MSRHSALCFFGLAITSLALSLTGKECAAALQDANREVKVVSLSEGAVAPDAEVDSEGNIHVTYFEDNNVYYTRSGDNGTTFSERIRANSEEGFAYAGAYRGPDLAIGSDNSIHIVWYNAGYQQKRPRSEWGVMYSRLLPGMGRFEPSRNLNGRPSDNFSLACSEDGRVAVIWMADGLFANLSGDNGTSFGPTIDAKTDPCECCGSRAEFTAEGSLVVLYRDKANNDRDTFVAVMPRDRQVFSHCLISQEVWQIDSCPMTGCFLSKSSTGLLAAWETRGQICFAPLTSSGERATKDEIVVGKGRYPVVLAAGDLTRLVAWKDGTKLCWQQFDQGNNPIGEPGANQEAGPDRPAGVVARSGGFVLFP